MNRQNPSIHPRAIAWALLSQMIWLPLVAIEMHDRWVAHLRQVTPPNFGSQLDQQIARGQALSLEKLLGASEPLQGLARNVTSPAGVLLSTADSGRSSLLDRPLTRSIEQIPSERQGFASGGLSKITVPGSAASGLGSALGSNWLTSHFTRAQLLGGSLDLNDLHEGRMSPLAMVERAASLSGGDPMGPLPSLWRDPMRQAILQLPGAPRRIATARVFHVPSLSVSRSTEVPLAIQSDGSVDILQTPDNPSVIKEIDTWSRHQQRPAVGSVVPAVIHLHPLEPAPVLSPDRPPAAQAANHSATSSVTPSASAAMTSAPAAAPAAPLAEVALPSAPAAPVAAAPVIESAPAAAPLAQVPLANHTPAAAGFTP